MLTLSSFLRSTATISDSGSAADESQSATVTNMSGQQIPDRNLALELVRVTEAGLKPRARQSVTQDLILVT